MPVWEQRYGRIRRPWYFHIEKHMLLVGDEYEPVYHFVAMRGNKDRVVFDQSTLGM